MLDDLGRRLEHAYSTGIEAHGTEVHFLILLSFLASFGFIRTSTHMIKAQVSWWPGNVSTKGAPTSTTWCGESPSPGESTAILVPAQQSTGARCWPASASSRANAFQP